MKTYNQIAAEIAQLMPVLKNKYKVKTIGVFGSYAKNTHKETSDLDLLVEFSEPVGFLFFDLKDYLESALGLKVDLVTKNALKPLIKEAVLHEVRYN